MPKDGDPKSDPLIAEEQNIEQAKLLVSHLDSADFHLYQEYDMRVSRREENFGRPDHTKEDTHSQPDPYYEAGMDKYKRILSQFNVPKEDELAMPPFGHLYVQYGLQDQLYTVEGAGRITHDQGGREAFSSFSLRFDTWQSQSAFLNWLREDGTAAMRHVFDRAANEYDDNNNLVKRNLPPIYAVRGHVKPPFETELAGVTVLDRPVDYGKKRGGPIRRLTKRLRKN